jgi:hypothetical protein
VILPDACPGELMGRARSVDRKPPVSGLGPPPRGLKGKRVQAMSFTPKEIVISGQTLCPDRAIAHPAKTRTFVWLGANRTFVGQFVEFPIDMLVTRVTGLPPTSTVNAPVVGRH